MKKDLQKLINKVSNEYSLNIQYSIEKILDELTTLRVQELLEQERKAKELHGKTNKPRPQWWIDKITKAYEEAKKEGYSN